VLCKQNLKDDLFCTASHIERFLPCDAIESGHKLRIVLDVAAFVGFVKSIDSTHTHANKSTNRSVIVQNKLSLSY